jgi:hypothetical protein
LPRFFTPPAAPVMKALGCPSSFISGFAGDGSPSRLESLIFRRCRLTNSPGCPGFSALRYRRRSVSGLPRILYLPAPADGSPSCLGSRTIRFCHRRISGLPRSFSSGGADQPISRLPQISVSSAVHTDRFSGLPRRFSLSAGPSMLPRVAPKLHLRLGR